MAFMMPYDLPLTSVSLNPNHACRTVSIIPRYPLTCEPTCNQPSAIIPASVSLSLSIYIALLLFLSFFLSLALILSLSLPLHRSVSVSLSPSLSLCFCLSLSPSLLLCFCLTLSPSRSLFLSVSLSSLFPLPLSPHNWSMWQYGLQVYLPTPVTGVPTCKPIQPITAWFLLV